jgi:hypothetical protein
MCFAEVTKHGMLEASKCVFHSSSGPHGFHVADGGHIEMDNSSIEHVAADAVFVQGETAFAKFVRMHISVCGRDALHCSYGAVIEMSDSRIMHAKRFGIAATTKGRAQIAGTVVDSSLHSGIAALTSEDTTPELSENSSGIKQPMHAGLPAGHVVAKKCSVLRYMISLFVTSTKIVSGAEFWSIWLIYRGRQNCMISNFVLDNSNLLIVSHRNVSSVRVLRDF